MNKLKTFKVNKQIEVVCETKGTRNGFKHTATLLYNGNEAESVKICYMNRTWEHYDYESVLEKLADKSNTLSDSEKKLFQKYIKNYNKPDPFFKTVAMVAKMGEVLATGQKAKNDWKARMLKAGLQDKGLIMPEDWDSLSEDTKQARLDGVIKMLG